MEERDYTDAELDQEWKGNARPQSTLARDFSATLDSLFQLDSGIEDLSNSVFQKKQSVTVATSELEQLEARLRATEERLRAMNPDALPPPKPSHQTSSGGGSGSSGGGGGGGDERREADATTAAAAAATGRPPSSSGRLASRSQQQRRQETAA